MAEERVSERIVERPTTTIVEQKRSGFGIVLGLIMVILTAIAVYFIAVNSNNETRETDAVTQAARDVGQAAQTVGDAATTAAEKVKPTEEQ